MSYTTLETSRDDGAPIELYRFVRGVDRWTWTSADVAVVYQGETYTPAVIQRNEPDQDQQRAGPLTVTVPRDNAVAGLFRVFVPAGTTGLTVYRAHRDDLADVIPLWQGRVRGVEWRGSEARIQCEALDAMLDRQALHRGYGLNCPHFLYDLRCKISAESFRVAGPLASLSGTTLTAAIFATQPDGWWVSGYVRVAQQDYRMVIAHTGDTVEVLSAFEDLSPNDIIETFAGCDRTLATCRTKFSNAVNYGGFPWIPLDNPFETGLVDKRGDSAIARILKQTDQTTKTPLGTL